MKQILVDTNVIVDVALKRQPFFAASAQVLATAEAGLIEAFISGSTVSDIYYIVSKIKGKELAIDFLRRIFVFCHVAAVDKTVIESALASSFKDFEDAIQEYAAVESQLDAIVTRNPKDFAQSSLSVLTPEQLLERLVAGEPS